MTTIHSLEKAVKKAWTKDTCYPPDRNNWTKEKPEIGQCAVTALIVQDEFHGDIVYNSQFDHYYNILPSGKKMDLTKGQFSSKITGPAVVVNRDEILYSPNAQKFKTLQRYRLLKKRLEQED